MGTHIGIDVSKATLDWAPGRAGKVVSIANQPRAIVSLIRQLTRLDVERVVLESTGGYERELVQRLAKAGLPVVVINPRRVRQFAESVGWLAKTDGIDAQLLAYFGETLKPEIRPIPVGTERLLADLIARRRQLIKLLVAEKNRLETAPREVASTILPILRAIEVQTAKLDTRIDALLTEDEDRAELHQLVQTIPALAGPLQRLLC